MVIALGKTHRQAWYLLFMGTVGLGHGLWVEVLSRTLQDDAFDLAQETYLRGFTQIDQFDGRSSVATWLYRIAVNEALQFLRRTKTMRIKLQELAAQRSSGCGDEEAGARLDVEAALKALSETDRAVLLLRYQEGLDYRAIADVVGCAEGTVASRLNRARERMRGVLQESYGHSEATDVEVHPNSG